MKVAVIIGAAGQDGTLLYELLRGEKYRVIGIDKNIIKENSGAKSLAPIDIRDTKAVYKFVEKQKPDEIYYLAAFHSSSEGNFADELSLYIKSHEVNVFSYLNFLDAIRLFSTKTKIFYAGSSHIYKGSKTKIQDESTPISPLCIYGITKATGIFLTRVYRKKYKIFASVGILYNHESCLRDEKFVSKKIIKGAINIMEGRQKELILGNLNSEVDWGYAPDYVEAMYKILQLNQADDFIIATGKKHSIREFANIAFKYCGLNYRDYIKENSSIIQTEKSVLVGDAKKLMSTVKWKPGVNFSEMIKILVEQEQQLSGK